ncbi:MAG: methionine adenosyltransferase, partial [Candidatus Liptonbacteria bacterium]|nr:methionine adenosyltransferase [Candidatus Liptonbacteria bacterium]
LGYEENLRVITNVVEQSPDIAQGVDVGGAGDQGIMYGFATNETPEFLPKGIVLVHELTKGLQNLRVTGKIKWLKPDGKAQITMKDGHVKTVLISTQHDAKISQDEIKEALKNELVLPLLSARGEVNEGVEILVNPTGIFVKGGFEADTGLTGRKIMVDTYGGLIAHGGGCFSGKDATKVDRSAAYMARFAAKNLVANGLAKECMVSVAYAIGKAEPLMVSAKNENGGDLGDVVNKNFNFQPGEIIRRLGLKQPIYLKTAAYGHFGKPDLPWEKIEKV